MFGTILGSFLNVLIYRTMVGENWVKGRSKCDHCGKQIRWYDNIPILSYIALQGKCRFCRKSIPVQYPVVEAITGILFVWWGVMSSVIFRLVQAPLPYVQPFYWLLMGFLLLGLFFADIYYGVILTNFVIGGLVLSLVYKTILLRFGELQGVDFIYGFVAALGAGLFFYVLHKGTRGRGMGEGDIWMAVLMGFLLGWPKIMVGILTSFVMGALVAVVLMLMGKKRFGQTLPFGPFLVMGTYVALQWGNLIWGFLFS